MLASFGASLVALNDVRTDDGAVVRCAAKRRE